MADDEADAHGLLDHYTQFPELEPALLEPEAAREEEPLLADGIWGCLLRTGYPISPLEATTAVADLRAAQAGVDFVIRASRRIRAVAQSSGREVVVAAGRRAPNCSEGSCDPTPSRRSGA